MYVWALDLHGVWRWVVIVTLVTACVEAMVGARGRAGRAVAWVIDTQLALGLVLLVISPVTRGATPDARYFYAVHAPAMALAVLFAHVGSISARRGDAHWRWKAGFSLGLALALVLAAVPWSRPLLRVLGA